jgi:hypothetical protein
MLLVLFRSGLDKTLSQRPTPLKLPLSRQDIWGDPQENLKAVQLRYLPLPIVFLAGLTSGTPQAAASLNRGPMQNHPCLFTAP